jgi:hypothetical protein
MLYHETLLYSLVAPEPTSNMELANDILARPLALKVA